MLKVGFPLRRFEHFCFCRNIKSQIASLLQGIYNTQVTKTSIMEDISEASTSNLNQNVNLASWPRYSRYPPLLPSSLLACVARLVRATPRYSRYSPLLPGQGEQSRSYCTFTLLHGGRLLHIQRSCTHIYICRYKSHVHTSTHTYIFYA